MADEPRRRLLFVDTWIWEGLAAIVTLVGLAGVLVGVFEYRDRVEAERAKETLAMIDIWETRGAHDAFRELSTSVSTMLAIISEDEKAAAREDEQLARLLMGGVARRVLRDPDRTKDFDAVVYFFNRLGLCVEAELCSEKTARIFFEDTVTSFMAVFEQQIEDYRRTKAANYAQAVLDLSQRFEAE